MRCSYLNGLDISGHSPVSRARRALAIGVLIGSGSLGACHFSVPADPDSFTQDAPLESRYLAQRTPGLVAELFAPGVVSTEAIELNAVFAPDGREFFFTRSVEGVLRIFHSELEGDRWSAPRPLRVFAAESAAVSVDMAVSPDGRELVFTGEHPHDASGESSGLDLWISARAGDQWLPATVLPPPVQTSSDELYPSVVADGSLYFISDRPGGPGVMDVYRASRRPGGGFDEPVLVGPPISSEASIGDTYVEPGEKWMVFSSRRAPSFGRSDLFVSFRRDDGSWGEPANLGPAVNSPEVEFCPMATPDGRYLFFSRRYGDTWATTTGGDVLWVDARILETLR